ncbi:MAG TPA: transposase [Candidatus Onthousia excrementipullorum]|uniref:Transposase n=1 Tax=Candidatus Onthousia excrementipullorum TaxID=2840884 RepID=A0A9D1J2R2_9FIRM|nr:transposase [Candidatus Onthousia excrementipullorum]
MNRKQRRELRKNKDLIKELYSIINKYLPDLLNMFSNLTDGRNESYITYEMKTICVTRLFSLLCGLTTMTDISSDTFNTDNCIKNLSKICGQDLRELPYWETIQDVFVNININELRNIQKYIVKTLIRSKMFDKFKYNGAFQLVFDGTGLSNHDYNLNNNCLIRKHKDGKVSYYKYVLECKLVVGNIIISLDSEFIENEKMLTEKQKQDCEIKAFKRMIKRIKKNYPKYKFIITGDALYAVEPIIEICEKNKWNYIFNLKPDRLKEINSTFEGNILCFNEVKHQNYYLSTNINYRNHILSAFKYI